MQIDLNCDLGEGGAFDADLMPLITTANVACGFHAGGPEEATAAMKLAVQYGTRVGAHPSFPDREHFGRREMNRPLVAVMEDCAYQVGALVGLAKLFGKPLSHVKPHGALYNMACRENAMALAVMYSAAEFGLPLMGLPASRMQAICAIEDVRFIPEGFADRRYRPDGTLVPRTESGAFVESPDEAVAQAEWLIRDRGIRSLCVHGDNPDAVAFVRTLRKVLEQRGFEIRAFA
jgi:5-oxoprolinase (ATP-hydrolysing) subunit A